MKKLLLIIPLLLIIAGFAVQDKKHKALVLWVYDGDTVDCEVSLGFGVIILKKVRLARIDAPEMKGKEERQGTVSKEALMQLLLGKEVLLEDKGVGKYGRTIGEIYINDTVNVSDWMVEHNLAVYKDYGKWTR